MDESNKSIEVAQLFQEVMNLFRHNMKKMISETGMSAPQGMVIGLLGKYKKMKITELSNHLCLSNSTISGIIDRLEAQEMVVRERSKEDKRVVYVTISPKYKDMHKTFHKKIEDNIKNTISRGSEEELKKIFDGLDTLKKLLINE